MLLRRRAACALSFTFALLGSIRVAHANTPEALFGLGARTNALGGAGTALANDFTAVYYNPAGLGYCGRSEVGLDLRHAMHSIRMRTTNPDLPEMEPVQDSTRATVGACFRMPYRLSLGIIFGTGLQRPASIDQSTVNDTPQYLLYGESHQQLTIGFGLAYRPVRQLSIGLGASVIINSALDIDVYAPIGVMVGEGVYDELTFDLHWDLSPTAAPYIGVIVQPIPELRLAITYRGPLKHHLDIPVPTSVSTGEFLPGVPALELELPLIVTADTWYQPRELAIGVTAEPIPSLTITADLTWYNYSAYNSSPFPFLGASWDPTSNSFLTALVALPERDPIGFRDVWQPRVGVEGRLLDGRLAIRGGYSVRRAAVAIPQVRNTNIFDNTINAISVGAGYTFGPRNAEELAARAALREANRTSESPAAAEPGEADPPGERVAFGDDRSDLESATDTMPVMLRLDGYFRATVLRDRTDEHKQTQYGGRVMEVGITSSLGWY